MAKTARGGRPQAGWVLDTSAVLNAAWSAHAEACIAPPGVADEIRPGGRTHAAWQRLVDAGLRIEAPPPGTLERVTEAARRLGETGLSRADLEVAALGLFHHESETGAKVVTDDYALQNLLMHFGVPHQAAREQGIREKRRYRLRCAGCGRWYSPGAGHQEDGPCPVCGSALRRRRPKN